MCCYLRMGLSSKEMAPLFNIEARAKIGRAKDVHKDVYQEQYNQIEAEIRQQIAQVSAGGENA